MPHSAIIPRHVLPAAATPAHAQPFRLVPLASYLRHNADLVHRHDFYELLWITRGAGTHAIDFAPYPLQDHTLVLIAPGQVHHLQRNAARLDEALVLIFNEEFFVRDASDRELLAALTPPAAVLAGPVGEAGIGAVLALLADQYAHPVRDYELLRTVLKLVLLLARQLVRAGGPGPGRSLVSERVHAFRVLVETEYVRWHRVAPYAARLALSAKRLDQLCRAALGKSAQRLVHERLALEAQRRLAFEAGSVKEIAFGLGFEDPSYFSRFFRALTGTTPKDFRRQFPDSTRM